MKGTIWCLHGAVGHSSDWQGFSVDGWAVKRVDLWRFLDCCPMALNEFGRAINEEAREVTGPHVLLGYSMGGRLALHALTGNSPPWDAAVIVSAHPGLENPMEREARLGIDAEWAAKAITGEWGEFLDEWNAQSVLKGEVTGLTDRRLLAQRRRSIGRSFVDWSLGAQAPLWEDLRRIELPILWVCGSKDAKFHSIAERAVACLPDAALAVISGAGHRVPWEAPDVFADEVEGFLGGFSVAKDKR